MTPLYPGLEPPHPAPERPPGHGRDVAEPAEPAWLEKEWDLPALLGLLMRRWWLVVGVPALGLLLALLLLAQWPRAYTAAAVILINPDSQPKVDFEELLTGAAPDDQSLSSEVLVLRAPDLAAQVVRQLQLAAHPDFNPDLPQHLPPYAIWQALPMDWLSAAEPPAVAEARLDGQATRILAAFADRLEVERIGRSHAVQVAVTSHDAGLAADVANALADRYLADQLKAKLAATNFAGAWLDKRVADLRAKVEAAERAVEAYRVETGLIDANGSTVTTQQLGELNTQLIVARGETAAARARLDQVRGEVLQRGNALAAAEVLTSPLIHSLKSQEVEVLRRRAELAQEYGARHPRMLSIRAELANIQAKIAAEVGQIVAGLSNALAVAEAKEAALLAALDRTEAAAAEQGTAQVRLHALERDAESSRTMLQTFMQRTKQTSDQQDIQRPDARILVRAVRPERPSEPRRVVVLGGAGSVSLLLGLALALGLGLREQGLGGQGFGSSAALRVRLGLPVLGLVPQQRWRRGSTPADAVAEAPLGSFAEAVRMIAAGLGGARVVMVTAALAEEGKTTLALALARTLAAQGGRVLLVDADLRRAGLSAALGLARMQGLAEAQALGEVGAGVPLAGDRVRGLQVLPAGLAEVRVASAGQSGDLLAPLLAHWRERYDHIIIDAAPVLLVAEVVTQARLADAALLAVRWRATPAEAVREAAQRLREAEVPLVGTVLTRVGRFGLGEAGLGYGGSGGYSAGLSRLQAGRGSESRWLRWRRSDAPSR